MQVKSVAEHSAILLTFIKLPVVIKTFVLSVFEWPFYTGFTVLLLILLHEKLFLQVSVAKQADLCLNCLKTVIKVFSK